MHDIEIPAQNTAYTQWSGLVAAPLKKSATFFQASLFTKTGVLIMKIMLKLQRMTTQIVRNNILLMKIV